MKKLPEKIVTKDDLLKVVRHFHAGTCTITENEGIRVSVDFTGVHFWNFFRKLNIRDTINYISRHRTFGTFFVFQRNGKNLG